MEFLIVLVAVAALIFWRAKVTKQKEEAASRKAYVVDVAYKAQKIADKVSELKTNSAKANHCAKAQKLLESISSMPEAREVVKNFDEIFSRLESMQKVFPVIGFVEKSYKHRFKGKAQPELNALQDALYEINTQGIEDKDFEIAMVFPEGTGEIVTIGGIEQRCIELGWEPKTSI